MVRALTERLLSAAGWTVHNELPDDLDKCVVIGAPHTSNWDLAATLAVAATLEIDFSWVGKREIFEGPYGGLMRRLGGVSVDRSRSHGYVEQLAEKLRRAEEMALVIAPEGTRSRGERWKSGFFYIAREAGVPICLGYVDYGRRQAGLGPLVDSSRPRDEVMGEIREFYADKTGFRPDNFTPPTLSE